MKINETLLLTLVQLNPIWEDAEANIFKLSDLLKNLNGNTDVVILPEAFLTGFSMDTNKVSDRMDGDSLLHLKRIASEKDVAICGSLFIKENGKYFNRFIWLEPDGKIFTYDKRHLFSLGNENLYYSKGDSQLLIEYKGWRIFPQICYDLRFPVWSRNTQNYDLLINVANWPASRTNIWKTLLKARAIENQCYVAAVNRTGTDGNSITYRGDSMVIDFKGEIIAGAQFDDQLIHQKINRKSLQTFKNKFDTLKDADEFTII